MTSIEDRAKGYEGKFAHDQEQQFKLDARRNKLFGLWLAERFGLHGEAATAYAKDVVIADLEEPGDEDVVRKVLIDIKEYNSAITEKDVREKLLEFYVQACEETE